MSSALDLSAVRTRRLHAQRLDAAAPAAAPVDDVVRAVGGIQAQDMRAATLGVAVRRPGLRGDQVTDAREAQRTIVRTWCMRGTLHLVPADLLPVLLAVFAPVYIPRGRRRLAALGLTDGDVTRGIAAIADALADHAPLSRHELATAVRQRGVPLGGGQAPIHLVRRACLEGVVCETGTRGREPVYALRRDWLPAADVADRPAALATVARWYTGAFGPASRADFAAWSGLPNADVAVAWDDAQPDAAPDSAARAVAAPPTADVRLLPAFDSYLLGYRDRSHAIAPDRWPHVNSGGGIIRPTVLVDGRVVGTWRTATTRGVLHAEITAFAPLDGVQQPTLDAAADAVRRALDRRVTVALVE